MLACHVAAAAGDEMIRNSGTGHDSRLFATSQLVRCRLAHSQTAARGFPGDVRSLGLANVASAEVPRIQAGRIRVEIDRVITSTELLFPSSWRRRTMVVAGSSLWKRALPLPIRSGRTAVRLRGPDSHVQQWQLQHFSRPFGEIYPYSESGLLGLAFHPGFAIRAAPVTASSTLFIRGCRSERDCRFDSARPQPIPQRADRMASGRQHPNVVDVNSRREIFRNPHVHNSGTITFGPDGYLYGSIGTPPNGTQSLLTAQNNADILGTIYRIDPLAPGSTPGSTNPISANGKYRIPEDNPFVDDPLALGEIYAYGLRNAYRFSIDPVSGLLFGGEVGESFREEVNVIPKGGNMGWPYREGDSLDGPLLLPPPPTVPPLAQYSHDDGAAIVGGYVYHGSIAALQNKYIFGDFSNQLLLRRGRLLVADVFDESVSSKPRRSRDSRDAPGSTSCASRSAITRIVPSTIR